MWNCIGPALQVGAAGCRPASDCRAEMLLLCTILASTPSAASACWELRAAEQRPEKAAPRWLRIAALARPPCSLDMRFSSSSSEDHAATAKRRCGSVAWAPRRASSEETCRAPGGQARRRSLACHNYARLPADDPGGDPRQRNRAERRVAPGGPPLLLNAAMRCGDEGLNGGSDCRHSREGQSEAILAAASPRGAPVAWPVPLRGRAS